MNVSKEMKREEGLVMKRSMKKIELNSKKSMGSLKRVDKESRVNSKKNIVSIKTILQE